MVKIEDSWGKVLNEEFEKEYFMQLVTKIKSEICSHLKIYPKGSDIFKAFELTPYNKVKVVILGQDPYHGEGQAHGLSFSVPVGTPIPPSLQNIFKELKSDTGKAIHQNGDLSDWAKQGVFLLNSVLTVRAGLAASHSNIGWSQFTDRIISLLSNEKEGLVFMLWGNFARSKANLIDRSKHLVLEAAHPSPLARGAFFGCRHFSKCNNYLIEKEKSPINW